MARFGGDNFVLRRRPQLLKYAKKLPKPNLRNIIIALVVVFILRNLLKNDYRKEEMNYLRDPEMHTKEIEKALSMPEAERQIFINSRGNDVDKLKHDIGYLLNEVHSLRAHARDPNNSINDRASDLKAMDHLHMEKRKAKEEQLLKDHPDFVPSRRSPKGENKEGATATN
jgi:hypothetical protein